MKLDPIAKTLITVGALLITIGIGWQFGWIQHLRIGHLPGDIYIEKENFRMYIPITTSILISLIFALVSWLIKN
ncbi:MAG: DUF2905 domain-containing protein [Pseudobdellovibrionaceae bacterium]